MKKRTLRVVSWNVENLAAHLGKDARRAPLAEILDAFGTPDVLCLQELRLRAADRALAEAAEHALPGYVFAHSLANDPVNARFRGGRTYGVGTYVRRTLSPERVAAEAWDREGRMIAIVLAEFRLAIVNVYAVNGTDKPHWDHDLGRYEGTRHDWKRRFHEHAAALTRSLAKHELDALLIGDWNVSQTRADITPRLRTEEPHATSRAHFASVMMRELGMVDVFRELHPDARAYTWFSPFARGSQLDAARVDFALLPRSRLVDVVDASIDESPAVRFGSDHAPLSVSLRHTS